MAIDLDRCTGCQACVVACHAENNLPLSDPESAAKGRAVHWIRVDRYYEGEFPNIRVKYMPVLCQHCDEAPCEPVCPVYATYKNPEGLNVQVYNRCVGTRYCANNCPYSVRFFNWFDPGGRRLSICSTIRTFLSAWPGSWRNAHFAFSGSRERKEKQRKRSVRSQMGRFSPRVSNPARQRQWCLAI
jgi:Fe-S-cluster-containing dehydrogenase component